MKKHEYNWRFDRSIELSIVVPCYNSNRALNELNDRLRDALKKIEISYEIIYINDASLDNTAQLLKEIALRDENIVAIDLMFNVGQFKATMCGLEYSKGKFVVTMDDDLQHPPEELHKLYFELKNNPEFDAVIGNYNKKQHSFIRNLGTAVVLRTLGADFRKHKYLKATSSFRCLTRLTVNAIREHKTMFPSIGRLVFRSSRKIKTVEVDHSQRKYGNSNYSVFKLFKALMNSIFSYTTLPLRFISVLGIAISMVGFTLGLYYLIRYIFSPVSLPGWTTLVVLVNIYSGFLLLSVGVIGEYLIRVLQEVNGYPRYYIKSINDRNQKSSNIE